MPPKKQGRSSASRSGRTQRRKRSTSIWPIGTRPSDRVAAVMRGTIDPDPGIMSAARLLIHQEACRILKRPREERAALVEKHPETIREMIRQEVVRIWTLRKS